jgi:hypothetical protein
MAGLRSGPWPAYCAIIPGDPFVDQRNQLSQTKRKEAKIFSDKTHI